MIIELIEVKKFFEKSEFSIQENRIEQLYNMISEKESRVNDLDKQWVACEQNYEKETVIEAIHIILDQARSIRKLLDHDIFLELVEKTCLEFQAYTHKPRIPFYIVVLDKLVK